MIGVLKKSKTGKNWLNLFETWLTGVTSTGYSCGICKYKAHKSCASNVVVTCKWTTLNTVEEKCLSTLNVRKLSKNLFMLTII